MTIAEAKNKLHNTKDFFTKEVQKVRGGRANPQLIEDMTVSVYNSVMPIKQLGTVNVVDPTLITVQCWDKENADAICKVISESDLNVNPSVDGSLVRVPLPPLTEERRVELTKVVKKLLEEVKISIRNIRREFIDSLEEENEDEKERGEKEIQKLVDEYNELVDKEYTKKEQELMTV
ncbi:MAG: ribosome recycling factor [Candidatus Dojkabacteria bacterium]|nr:ribosome recycling factor [Candidatus Dojkabacteria bacterium]